MKLLLVGTAASLLCFVLFLSFGSLSSVSADNGAIKDHREFILGSSPSIFLFDILICGILFVWFAEKVWF